MGYSLRGGTVVGSGIGMFHVPGSRLGGRGRSWWIQEFMDDKWAGLCWKFLGGVEMANLGRRFEWTRA